MKSRLLATLLLLVCTCVFAAEQPLRIFLRVGRKTHGPAANGQHDGPTFLKEWKPMLAERGATVDGAIAFPTAEQLENTDVLVMYTEEGGRINATNRANLEKFLKRGGGIVAIHDSVCGNDAQWWKTIIGGAWEHGYSKWLESDVPIYYLDQNNPITKDCSNFEFDDEIYYDLHMMPEAKILAGSWTPDKRNARNGRLYQHIYDVCPQMWTYEKDAHRAFVAIPGHHYKNFNLPHFRTVLLRGIAWAGKRDVDSLCKPEELASLRYPEGGPTDPKKAAQKLELHPDFNISLAAAEPLINKPMALDWDPAGRIWVAETPEYPNGRRGIRPDQTGVSWKDHGGLDTTPGLQNRPAHDRISILIDSDNDGLADKKEVFYEGLELVTGFVFHRDGVIVSQAPDILWLRDTDGDGKADKVEKLYTGLGTQDTHAVINNLRRGFDGWVYATHGYSAGNVKSGDGKTEFGRISSGVVRFRPDGTAFEQFSSKGGNTWGLDITADNEVMFTQPTSDDLLNHVVLPESILARGKLGNVSSFKPVIRARRSNPLIKHESLAYVQIDLVGRFTAAAGCAIQDSPGWPAEWNNSYFTTEPTINIAHHEIVKPDGVSFTANKTRDEEFIGGRDKWFRPIETRIGPDGALYILDFYNQAVIHNDTRGPKHNAVNAAVRPDRDHYFGRIWRVQHKEAKPAPVPNLAKASAADLVKALDHPNRPVRMTAHRLIAENPTPEVTSLVAGRPTSQQSKIHRIWLLGQMGKMTPRIMNSALSDSPAVRRAALQVAALAPADANQLKKSALGRLNDPEPRVRLEAIVALGAMTADKEVADALLKVFAETQDAWTQSAIAGVAAANPLEFIRGALASSSPDTYRTLINTLTTQAAQKGEKDPEVAAVVAIAAAQAPASADALRIAIFETLSKSVKPEFAPKWSEELRAAFKSTIDSPNAAVHASVLPLIARWDRSGAMAEDLKGLIQQLMAKLNDAKQSDTQRAQVANSLVGVRQMNAEIIPTVAKLLSAEDTSLVLLKRLVEALGSTSEPSVGTHFASAYAKLPSDVQEMIFAQMIKRGDWSLALVNAISKNQVPLATLGPSSVFRLRNHADATVSKRANEVIDELRGPEVKEKNALIAKFTPEIEKPGNLENGHKAFTQNCAVCHKFNGEGKDLAPDLTGMGVHGAAELLVHILDPNRMFEENFVSTSIETKSGETYDGVIARENAATVLLRNVAGDTEIKTSDIKSKRSTGRSVMPEGFEALGAETLRDMIAYMSAGEGKYRLIDMKGAFTADSRRGIFNSQEATQETLRFRKFGLIKAGNVPFDVVNPVKVSSENNVLVLKGGTGFARTLPQKVEIPNVNVKATKLHFLGGVGGWAYPCCGPNGNKDLPVAKVSVLYADGQSEDFVLKNGVEFADYISPRNEVPGSKLLEDAVSIGQVRYFDRALRGGTIQKITIESFNNTVAPVFVAMTAEQSDSVTKFADASAATGVASDALPAKPLTWGAGTKVLLVGGGTSHDFNRFFNRADTEILKAAGCSVNYTEDADTTARELPKVDVVILSVNKAGWDTPEVRKAVFDFANVGKGIVLLHAGVWLNYAKWPEYNAQIVGGMSRGHDRLGEFEVKVLDTSHPITKGVPESFRITDELYYFNPDPAGTPVQVLAQTSTATGTKKEHPSVWIVKHPKARIAGIALGHDARAHDLPAFKTLLQNAVKWAANQ